MTGCHWWTWFRFVSIFLDQTGLTLISWDTQSLCFTCLGRLCVLWPEASGLVCDMVSDTGHRSAGVDSHQIGHISHCHISEYRHSNTLINKWIHSKIGISLMNAADFVLWTTNHSSGNLISLILIECPMLIFPRIHYNSTGWSSEECCMFWLPWFRQMNFNGWCLRVCRLLCGWDWTCW